ncbi:MAG TPA: hypothetical protein VGI64_17185 [Streptosporangiaceae bacterium]
MTASQGEADLAGARLYTVNDRPVALVRTLDGGEDCLVFDFATGELTPDRRYFEYVIPGSGKDVEALTEAEFRVRLSWCRAEAGARAAGQVREWAERMCATSGAAVDVAAALGLRGTMSRGDITVAEPPAGYTRMRVETLGTTGAAVELLTAGRLLTRPVLDAGLGQPRWVPMAPEGRLLPFAYLVSVEGAKAHCTVFAEFEHRDAAAVRLLLRRDRVG